MCIEEAKSDFCFPLSSKAIKLKSRITSYGMYGESNCILF